MTSIEDYSLDDRYVADDGRVFLTGIQALARLPIEQLRVDRRAGSNTAAFVSGYQGSPLGGYGEAVAAAAQSCPDLPVVFRPGMNEEFAATAVMGSQLAAARPDTRYDGVVGIWYGKAPGVDRAADALRHAVYAGTSMHGGAVALVGDDPAAKSSTVPSSSAGLVSDMHMPLLYPGDPGEALDLGRHTIALSRATGLWCALKIVADVADATASVVLDPDRISPVVPLLDGRPYVHVPDGRLLTPHTIEIEREILEVRYELALRYAAENRLNHVTVDPGDAWIGIVSSGITYREVREALARLGLGDDATIAASGIRLLKMGMPLPFNADMMRRFAAGVEQVLVVEEKRPNIESLLKDALYTMTDRPVVVGKLDESGERLCPAHGALDADTIVPILRSRLEARLGDRLVPPPRRRELLPLSVSRTPFFCSGCPHNRSTEIPAGSLVGAGIGCHTMTLLMDPERVGDIAGLTCMGNEGTQWIGMADFVDSAHLFQNLGDGTYFHSGQLAVQAAVAAGVDITYKLLFNGTVAMTGGQDPEGQLGVADVASVLLTQGVSKVVITTDDVDGYRDVELASGVEVRPRTRLIETQEELASTPGVTVLIHDQACAAELRRARKRGLVETPTRRVVINDRICEGCGDCGEVSNCLSVQPIRTPFGPKTMIDQSTCNFDYSCLEGDCPSFMTIERREPGRLRRWLRRRPGGGGPRDGADVVEPPELPDPALVVPADDFAMRITGIGGTGVVTVAQILGTAAMLDGYHVRGLDQIGLSQKAGPVVSDIRLSRSAPTATNRLGEGQADLLLAFDQLVAASSLGLLTADEEATVVVGSSSATPTGEMITHLDVSLPSDDALRARLAERTRGSSQHWADAVAVTNDLFGRAASANIFVVGMAVQAGALPIGAERIEQAISLNGVAVEANRAAFAWGRAQVADPEAVAAARRVRRGAGAGAEGDEQARELSAALVARIDALGVERGLGARLRMFASELVAWQDESIAEGWLDVCERVGVAERRADPSSTRLLGAVAAGLFKLSAYKDEYEVARLMLDDEAMAAARALAGDDGVITWKLHPPILRALGIDSKIGIGSWATPVIRALAAQRKRRGTALDVFGRSEVRRVEQELPREFVAAVDGVLGALSVETLDAAVGIAELPDVVRGYEEIKLANVAEYRRRLDGALRRFHSDGM